MGPLIPIVAVGAVGTVYYFRDKLKGLFASKPAAVATVQPVFAQPAIEPSPAAHAAVAAVKAAQDVPRDFGDVPSYNPDYADRGDEEPTVWGGEK